MKEKLLFICKRNHSYNSHTTHGHSTGLRTSVELVVAMLNSNGIEAKLAVVHDNNNIDHELAKYRPTICIIEALWVVPSKFDVLRKLHPNVGFIVRLHSDLPFISQEGVAIQWIYEYIQMGIRVACNSDRILETLYSIRYSDNFMYLPNYYSVGKHEPALCSSRSLSYIHIGGFGSIRPLKNQLIQCAAAIKFADSINKSLVYHINGSRVEQNGEPVLRNIRALIHASGHTLAEHQWLPHDEFIALVREMDLGLQVSFSETFNIVSADFASNNIPIVTSDEIKFIAPFYQANCTDVDSIVHRLRFAYKMRRIGMQRINRILLKYNSSHAERIWIKAFGSID